MATQGMALWSTIAASNATADPAVNWAEGMAPSAVNDSGRGMMASVAKWRDDLYGLTTAGTSTAYTVTTNATYATAAAMSGAVFTIIPHTTSGAAPTLSVDTLTARAINVSTGVAIPTGSLVAGTPYKVKYVHATTEFILFSSASVIPPTTAMLFQQTAAPTGWTKVTTHNDKALRIVSGTASTGGSAAFTTAFAARTIAQENLPSYNLSASGLTVSGTISPNIGGSGLFQVAKGETTNAPGSTNGARIVDAAPTATHSLTAAGNIPSGGSGTAIDFAVSYVDVIIATKD